MANVIMYESHIRIDVVDVVDEHVYALPEFIDFMGSDRMAYDLLNIEVVSTFISAHVRTYV